MSPVIYTPPTPQPPLCHCQPPMWQAGYAEVAEPAYPVDTVWACGDCGQRWIVETEIYEPPTIAGQLAGVTREFTRWVRHDKDTP